MLKSFRSFAVGGVSGALTYAASIHTLGYTSAFVMPRGFPAAIWYPTVVFGLGASLVAFLIHLVALRTISAKVVPAFISFSAAVVFSLAIAGQLPLGLEALIAWLAGTLLASAAHNRLRHRNSSKSNPLRGST